MAAAWNDFAVETDMNIQILRPQPHEPGIDVHVLISDNRQDGRILLLTELSVQDNIYRLIREHTPGNNGYQTIAHAGIHLSQTSRVTFRHHGRYHYGFQPLPGESGQYWHINIQDDRPAHDEDIVDLMPRHY